ncbi:MAG: lactate dehydrogenase-like 2-hydroxyacid dehydrogenase [Paracoccaceae bacterium]|jgi:lactate dehydrogenase-like 2-hydroxyacid dehydrogenase
MRLLISRQLPDAVMAEAAAEFELTARDVDGPMTAQDCIAALAEYDAIVPTLGDGFSAEVFDAIPDPRCKLLANFGAGYNHINIDAARKAGLSVTNTPGAVTDSTADIAMTLMLMSARRAAEGERMVRAGKWAGWTPTQMLGLHVTGKTVAIIGMGRIGQAIAKRCHFGFGMRVIFHNRSPKTVDFPATQMALPDTLGQADVVIVAVASGVETHHLIGRAELAAMQPHAHFINISRGDVVDEAALIVALQNQQIAGAGLDVYEFEPKVPRELIALETVTLLPHLGTAALEAREAMGRMALSNALALKNGEPLPNLVW